MPSTSTAVTATQPRMNTQTGVPESAVPATPAGPIAADPWRKFFAPKNSVATTMPTSWTTMVIAAASPRAASAADRVAPACSR